MATITTKFSLGDEVWKIVYATETIKLPCRFCRGEGWLNAKGANEESRWVKCPECDQNAIKVLGSWPEWQVDSTPLQIGQNQPKSYDRTGGAHRTEQHTPE